MQDFTHQSNFTFDIFLACCFPLAILLVVYRLSVPWTSWTDLHRFLSLRHSHQPYGPFSLEKAYQSYAKYGQLAANELAHRRTTYNTLSRGHKRLGNKIGYPTKLNRLQNVTDLNEIVTEGIAGLARKEFPVDDVYMGSGDIGRVRESLKHFIRDWSEEGAKERSRIFKPILDVLIRVEQSERGDKTVLVPGSGLGRLAWEISQLGFDTMANELSFFMNLAFRFLLSPETTTSKNEHTLRPYSHWFSHQRTNDSLFRKVAFPDAIPRITPKFRLAESDFLSLPAPAQNQSDSSFWSAHDTPGPQSASGYDYIVTLFFIDTSLNIFATLEHIYTLLRPGGTWINMGPLLWTAGGKAKVELSLDEVIQVATEIGFTFYEGDAGRDEGMEQRTVECEYTGDSNAMMRWIYKAEFWIATKSK